MAEDFIIVDKNGDEHHFPAGMDPKKAANIVRKSLGMPDVTVTPAPVRQTLGNPGGNIPIAGVQPKGTFDTTEEDTTAGKVAQSLSLASIDPLTGLGAPVDSMFGSQAAKLAGKIPFRSIASGALNKASSTLDYMLPSWATPKKSILEKIASTIGETPKQMPKGYYGNMPPTPEKPPIFGKYDLNPKPPIAPTNPSAATGLERVPYTPPSAPPSDVPDIEGFSRYEIGPQPPKPVASTAADPLLDELSGVPYAAPSAPVEVGTLTGGAQSTSDELVSAVTDALNPQGPKMVELPPQPELAGGGPFRQSGKFGKSGSKGQAGGYSSGTPSVPTTEPMEGWAGYSRDADVLQQRNAYSSGDAADPSMMATPEDMGMANELPIPNDSGVGAVAERPVTSLTETPATAPAADMPKVTPEQAQQARSFLGSRDAARALGITEQQLKELAPGPSRTPGIVDAVKAGENRGDLTDEFLKSLGLE